MVTNPLHFLVFMEGGAVAVLATALAKGGDAQPSRAQRDFWKSFAELCDLKLSNAGPTAVEVEYDGIDLLVVWDDWAILIEAKTSAASVRTGQLQTYYDRFRQRRGQGWIVGHASKMAVVFLTPPGVGSQEFDSLSIDDPRDTKRHVDWARVLARMESSFSSLQPDSQDDKETFLRSLILQGAHRIRELLANDSPGPTAVTWTPERRRCREFAKQVQNRIIELWDDRELHFNPIWSDRNGDELYANMGGARTGNVYFFVSSESKIQETDSEPSTLIGRLYFKLALRASNEHKHRFEQLIRQPLKGLFGAYNANVDRSTATVTSLIESSRPRSELCDEIASLFSLYLIVFRRLMN